MIRIYNNSESTPYAFNYGGKLYIVQPRQGEYRRVSKEEISIHTDPLSEKKSRVRLITHEWIKVSDKKVRNYVDGPKGLASKIQSGTLRKLHKGDLMVQRDYDKLAQQEFEEKERHLRELEARIALRERQLAGAVPPSRGANPELVSANAEASPSAPALANDGGNQPVRPRSKTTPNG